MIPAVDTDLSSLRFGEREFQMVTRRLGLAATAVVLMAAALISFAAPI